MNISYRESRMRHSHKQLFGNKIKRTESPPVKPPFESFTLPEPRKGSTQTNFLTEHLPEISPTITVPKQPISPKTPLFLSATSPISPSLDPKYSLIISSSSHKAFYVRLETAQIKTKDSTNSLLPSLLSITSNPTLTSYQTPNQSQSQIQF